MKGISRGTYRIAAMLLVFIMILTFMGVSLARAGGAQPYVVEYSQLAPEQQGPDEIFYIPQYNLVCVYKGYSLSCVCPCKTADCASDQTFTTRMTDPTAVPVDPTAMPTNPPTEPTSTPVQPTATSKPTEKPPGPTATFTPPPLPTATGIPPTATNVPPTVTGIPPTATSVPPTPKPFDGVRIKHYDGKGNLVWDKCMPPSAWNGHQSHPGHPIQDENLGGCYRN
jgi:hypothetical protein